jgi:hypothetical protein
MIVHRLETREKLNTFLFILQGVYWRLRESKVKFVECFVSKAFLKFEGIGTEESQVTLIQDIALCKDVHQTQAKVWIDVDAPNREASFKKLSLRRSHTETPSFPGSATGISYSSSSF